MHDIITVKNAKLKTVTVSIESLTVNGRQVTLAIYRQLIEEDLINWDTGDLNGLPWGTVNYHPQCVVSEPHVHVVWQKGDQLRREAVPTDYKGPPMQGDEVNEYLRLLMRDIALGRCDSKNFWRQYGNWMNYSTTRRGVEIKMSMPSYKDIARHFESLGECGREQSYEAREARSFFRNMPGDLKTAEQKVDAIVAPEAKRLKRVKASIEEIKKLPQLFIAV